MGRLSEVRKFICSRNEILFYLFFSIMLFAKGMGWYDGMPQYRLCLVLGASFLLAKLTLSRYTLPQFVMTAVLGGLGLLSYLLSREKGMFICMMLVIGMKDIPVRRAFQLGAVVWGGIFAYRVFLFLTGIEKGILLVHDKLGLGHIFRWSMGYPHPNVFHISYVILLAFVFYLRRPDRRGMKRAVFLAFLGNCFVFLYSVSMTGFLLTVIYLFGVVYFETRRRFSKWEKAAVVCILPLCLLFSLAAPLLPQGPVFDILNKMMNTRLNLSRYFLLNHPVSLFGQRILVEDSNLTMDNSYVFALMTYGAAPFVLLMAAYFLMIRSALKEGRRRELAITLGFLIAGISEPFLFNTSFKNLSLLFIGSYLYGHIDLFCRSVGDGRIGVADWGKRYLRIPGRIAQAYDSVLLSLSAACRKLSGYKPLLAVLGLAFGLGGGVLCAWRMETPQMYIVPLDICDFSEQPPFFLTEKQKQEYEEQGAIIPVYVDEETPMYRFEGNLIRLEQIRKVAGYAFLSGILGVAAGAACGLVLAGRKKKPNENIDRQ